MHLTDLVKSQLADMHAVKLQCWGLQHIYCGAWTQHGKQAVLQTDMLCLTFQRWLDLSLWQLQLVVLPAALHSVLGQKCAAGQQRRVVWPQQQLPGLEACRTALQAALLILCMQRVAATLHMQQRV